MFNIKWDNGVTGYISESEKELWLCEVDAGVGAVL